MKKQIWEIGGMSSTLPQKIDTQKEDELYLVFEILEDGELGFKVPLINNVYLNIYNRISYSKDKKTWIDTDINEYIPVKKGEIWYCKGECSSIGDYPIGQFSGINGLTGMKYNVSGNISSILDIRKENPDYEKILIETIKALGFEISNQQSPEEVLLSIMPEDEVSLLISACKYSDKNKTPAHFRNLLIAMGAPDVPGQSDEEFIKQVIIEESGGEAIELLSSSCIVQCLLFGNEFGYLELPPKLDELFQSEDVVDASGLVIDYSTTCSRMFEGCHNLTKAPKLPMTTLLPNCYFSMFSECISLVNAPTLPATILADACYSNMFSNCTSLTIAPELPATTLALECYFSMFYGCTSLTTAPSVLPATILIEGCYSNMFRGCTSLTTAPKLPATNLVGNCYDFMFEYCIKLNNITMLATDISASDCLFYWVASIASTGTFVKHPDMTSLPTGDSGIPEGWTVKDAIV